MKKILKPTLLPWFTLIAGILGFGLRLWLFLGGKDDKGLLIAHHPAGILCFVLTAITLAVIGLCSWQLQSLSNYKKLFPARPLAGIGCIAATLGILYVNIRDLLTKQDTITIITLVVGVLAVAALVVVGLCRFRGKRPAYWLHSALTIYCMLHLVSQYRLWSGQPQLQIYFFPLMASVFLMLTAYHHTVLDAEKKGSRRFFVFCNQAALFFCLLSLQGNSWPFYLAMTLWLATNLCSLQAAPEKEDA